MPVDILADLRDVCDSLTNPYQHREPRHTWSASKHKVRLPDHVVTLPGLIAQVFDAAYPGGSQADSGGFTVRPVPGSRPPGNPRALACYLDIHIGVAKWTILFGLDSRDTVESQIRLLVASAPTQDPEDQGALLDELHRWRRQCEIIAGWRDPDPQLEVPCPVEGCGERALRVNLAEKTARCTACGSRWAEEEDDWTGSIGLLARHIQDHKAAGKRAADRARADERVRKAARNGRSAA